MNINIYTKLDKIPNIINQDMQEKPKCYGQKVSWTTFKGLRMGIIITVLILDNYFSVAATSHKYQHLCKMQNTIRFLILLIKIFRKLVLQTNGRMDG